MLRIYGVDLLDLGSRRLSWPRFSNLVRRLPRDADSVRAVYGDAVEWGSVEHLLAAAVDALRAANWQRGGDRKVPRPEPIPRPGSTAARRHAARLSPDDMKTRLRDFHRRAATRRGG